MATASATSAEAIGWKDTGASRTVSPSVAASAMPGDELEELRRPHDGERHAGFLR